MNKFDIGNKVICIDPNSDLVNNQVYTVVGIGLDANNEVGYQLEGVRCTTSFVGFRENRFILLNQTLDFDFMQLSEVFIAADSWASDMCDAELQATIDLLAMDINKQLNN